MKAKKGQGISINVVIIAAIALIVLVVLWAIFTGRMAGFTSGVKGTQSCKAICEAAGQDANMELPDTDVGKAECTRSKTATDPGAGKGGRYIRGEMSDLGDNNICCCVP